MKKNILIIYSKNKFEIFNRRSALGSYIFSLAGLLKEYGSYHFVINGIDFDNINQNEIDNSYPSENTISIVAKKVFPEFLKKILKDILLFNRQKKLLKIMENNRSIDLIIEFYSYGSNIGALLSQKLNKPLLVVYDAPIIDEYLFFNDSKPFFKNTVRKREVETLLQSSFIVVYSNPVKKHIKGITGKNLNILIHQNVDFSRFEFIDGRKIGEEINIGFLGSFLRWHRVDLLLEAFIKLRKQGEKVHLFLLGDGEEFAEIKNKVNNCEFAKDITLSGYVDKEVLFNYKKQIDIGVMPSSNWYGAPNKIFEYGASGMAVVAPNTPTIIDLFENEKDLLLFENESFDELYNALLRLIDNRELMKLLANNLQNKIKTKYSKKNTFDFYNDIITKS